MLVHVSNKEEFDAHIKGDRVVVDFYATWCGPCMMLSPIIEELADELDDIDFLKVDVDQLPELAAPFRVSSIPAVFYLEKGKVVQSQIGYAPKASLRKNLGF